MTPPSDARHADVRRWRRLPLSALLLVVAVSGAHALAPSVLTVLDDSTQAWQALPAPEQQRVQASVQAWDALPLRQQQDQRGRYQAWLALDQAERSRLRETARQFAALPATEQARLRVLFEHEDVMRQAGWRLGPALGADWPRLQPLFAFVPPEQRADLLLALKQTDALQRDDLAALAQRIPPQSRDGFRREWLKQPAAVRGAWLHQRRNQ